MADFFANGQESSQLTYKPSNHLFTDPIRYFKANDPYYWEVDNIPLRQVQTNILWLKDQVGTTIEGVDDNVTRDNFVELRPRAAGDSDVVTVDPGRFMGRVNDAYGTGISKLVVAAYSDYGANKYNTDIDIQLDDSVLRKLIGDTITGMLGNNGLYDLLQHHVTNHTTNDSTEWNFALGTFLQNNEGLTNILDIPKIKLALWKQDTTANNYSQDANAKVDLQQMSVDFTRAWGAPFRTALVNVENQLSIAIPAFDEADYVDNSNNTYVPSTRIDLLFIYTKPIDASSTFIAKPDGAGPMQITTPQLGIVKGAGVVSLNGAGTDWSDVGDINTEFLNDGIYTQNDEKPENYFKASRGLGADDISQISSPLSDQNQDSMGTSGVYGNFPSPDDLMNLSPYIVDRLVGTKNLALVGQSILPIAYIFVTKGQVSITNNHILDIRPFFRTTELTYNERAGIAASNPPASLANPFVTNSDLVHRLGVFQKNIPVIDPGIQSIKIPRKVFFADPEQNYNKIINDKYSNQLGTDASPKKWSLDSCFASNQVPKAHIPNIVSVDFYVIIVAQEGDIKKTNWMKIGGGGVALNRVGYFRAVFSSAYLQGQYMGTRSHSFEHPINIDCDSEGVCTADIISAGLGYNFSVDEGRIRWWLVASGYTYNDLVVA